jgi:hypothetical protein
MLKGVSRTLRDAYLISDTYIYRYGEDSRNEGKSIQVYEWLASV